MATWGLIVDVGMHDGSDTEFFLAKGFDVLAIEANPHMVDEVSARLAGAVQDGRLTIVATAIADRDGEIDFFLSDNDLWASTASDMAERGIQGVASRKITVPCTTLDKVLAGYPTPHYVKVDIEGHDPDCVDAIGRLPEKPRYLSFEADLTDPVETHTILDQLESYGYSRFKLVNQAVHSGRRLPNPALEGRYVDVEFGKHHSGPFGAESPGPWASRIEVEERYKRVLKQQAARIAYSASGKVFGIPMSWLHRPLLWGYNLPRVTAARHRWAAWRGVEAGGWFDIHAGLPEGS